jgi:hypothetical protein
MAAHHLLYGNLFQNIPQIRIFRRFESPLDFYNDKELHARFRFRSDSIQYIADLVRDELERSTARNKSLSVEMQVLMAIRFFARWEFPGIGRGYVWSNEIHRFPDSTRSCQFTGQHKRQIYSLAHRSRSCNNCPILLPEGKIPKSDWSHRWDPH